MLPRSLVYALGIFQGSPVEAMKSITEEMISWRWFLPLFHCPRHNGDESVRAKGCCGRVSGSQRHKRLPGSELMPKFLIFAFFRVSDEEDLMAELRCFAFSSDRPEGFLLYPSGPPEEADVSYLRYLYPVPAPY